MTLSAAVDAAIENAKKCRAYLKRTEHVGSVLPTIRDGAAQLTLCLVLARFDKTQGGSLTPSTIAQWAEQLTEQEAVNPVGP